MSYELSAHDGIQAWYRAHRFTLLAYLRHKSLTP
jgi:hypothetical protein